MHELLAGTSCATVVARLGREVAPGGEVDRALVAERVSATPRRAAWLEGLLWPRVGVRVDEWRDAGRGAAAAAGRGGGGAAAVRGRDGGGLRPTVAVVADEEERERRAAARGHAAVAERGAAAAPQEEKAQRADFAVRNDGTVEELKEWLSRVLATLESDP